MKLVGESPVFLAVTRTLARMARFEIPILIEGETGTGKELAARVVHYQSERANRPFIPVNCGALPETLVENELFGHERGAFTDARESRPGVITLAEGGTLFLDEIEALSAKAQVSLLRFLQDHRNRPLGAATDRRANVRIIAATNQNLERLVERGEFRSDLFFRIKILFLNLPPLRLRAGDATLLADYFLDECTRRFQQPRKRLSPQTRIWLESYQWPGNVRELENLIVRESLMADGTELVCAPQVSPAVTAAAPQAGSYAAAKAAVVADFERRFVRDLLTRSSGNVTRAAAEAGKDRRAFGPLLKKHGLRTSEFRP